MDSTEITSEERLVARRWMRLWQNKDLADFDALHAKHFVDHCPAGRSPDRAGFRQGLETLYRAFPDFKAQIDDLIVDPEGSKVCIRWSATGTHKAHFMGVPPGGKQLSFHGIELIQIAAGLVEARWGEWNGQDLLRQLGHPAGA